MAYCDACGHYVEKEKDIEVVKGCKHHWQFVVMKPPRTYNEEIYRCCTQCGHVEAVKCDC